jgi:hypothetical protein
MQKFWVTAQWPDLKGNNDPHHWNIYLQDGKEDIGKNIEVGDRVMIYESQSGPSKWVRDVNGTPKLIKRKIGKQGIVTVAKVVRPLEKRDSKEAIETYGSGETKDWRWFAETAEPRSSGYISRIDMLRVFQKRKPKTKLTYNLRGFGPRQSGLKQIYADEYEALLEIFKNDPKHLAVAPTGREPRLGHWTEGGGEGVEHLTLKNSVASNAALVLKEAGVVTHQIEFPFGTCDRADIVLKDQLGKVIGVEIEIAQLDGQWEGTLQAIKYRHMLAVLFNQWFDEARAVLIAYNLADSIKKLCAKYEVQAIEVDRRLVAEWADKSGKAATLQGRIVSRST